MILEETHLKDLFIVTPEILEDNRGFFAELYHKDKFADQGVNVSFVQQNISYSQKGVVRGLHFQWDPPLGKLVRVTEGMAFAVAVDIRKKSPTLGKWFGLELGKENMKSLYAPQGFAFGFCVTGDIAAVQYLYTAPRNANAESSIKWNDSKINVKWPIAGEPILSEKDAIAQTFESWLERCESDCFPYPF